MTSTKNIKIEIDSKMIEALSTLCELSGIEVPDVINLETIETTTKRLKDILLNLKNTCNENNKQLEDSKKQINELKKHIDDLKKKMEEPKAQESSNKSEKEKDSTESETIDASRDPSKIHNILIIANLGVIMHQLKILFNKFGCKVTLVKSYSDAIGELKQQSYECILFDMSTLTENDFMLLEGLKKATDICHTNTLIVTLIIPTKDKKIMKQLKNKGADIIVEKHESWHMNILKELKLTQ